MAYSFGFPLLKSTARRETVTELPRPARPEGRLVWLHAPTLDAARSMSELARRVIFDEGCTVLLTTPAPAPSLGGLIVQPGPPDTPAEARAFLDHWQPDAAVMSEGELRPSALREIIERRVPLAMVDGMSPYILPGRERWWPGQMRGLLAHFRYVLTVDETAARAFRKAGGLSGSVVVSGRMEEGSGVLPCTEAERAALARTLATRPVWLAVALPEAEEAAVIAAHRHALRLAHRLLLVIAPRDAARAPALAAQLQKDYGWTVASRAADEEPEPETEVFLADGQTELGLWYRLAPVSYLGGSLTTGCLRDPMEAAALGSAVIHGPRPGIFGGAMGRLGAARATLPVSSPAELAEGLSDLLAPDRAARLAHAAWAVASDGTDVTDRVVALIGRMMDIER
ncbi:MAG: glycosyltransferase N-terminal domain-containing protein [Cereibacter changlensis]|uniref:3-deoxy-D-manno-octulosonic acid transferase n=2 Tax=Cereibacter changlensis TaxID=402884 RepID=A0A2T4JYE3_9RHOB|nr:glycosyltransferase N-terminal domain-containing protein [Cereibacter changlensis]PTE22817.1 3-deoxy-D-manno-octulosonic acid transferase [Cereibacter changlensis JA139]PZX58750.1 3-deoxy-D-manno-octulosonic-acid transferase [Cereibacter changlensis]